MDNIDLWMGKPDLRHMHGKFVRSVLLYVMCKHRSCILLVSFTGDLIMLSDGECHVQLAYAAWESSLPHQHLYVS